MNDENDPQAKLLAETLHGDWTNGPAAIMARRAAAQARRRRFVHRVALPATALVMIAALAYKLTPTGVAPSSETASAAVAFRPSPPLPEPTSPVGYEIVSDDELITYLRDRPLLIVSRPDGAREFTVFAQK